LSPQLHAESAGSAERSKGIFLLVAASLGLLVLLGGATLFGVIYVEEDLYPWEDGSPWLGVMHIENDSPVTVTGFFRWSDGKEGAWGPIDGYQRASSDLEPGASTWLSLPGVQPIDLRLVPSDGSAEFIVTHLPFVPDGHVRLRFDEARRCWVSVGGETWLGGPDFGPEHPVSPTR
jgi:hypothetical protein